MKIGGVDGKCNALSGSMLLMWCGSSQCGVKCDVGGSVICGSGGDVAAALAIRPGKRPTSAMFPGYAINGALKTPGGKCGAHFDFVAPLPPASAERVDDCLFGRFGLPELFAVLFRFLGYALALTFFRSSSCSSSGSGSAFGEPPAWLWICSIRSSKSLSLISAC